MKSGGISDLGNSEQLTASGVYKHTKTFFYKPYQVLTIQVLIISEDSVPGTSDSAGYPSTIKLEHVFTDAFTVFLSRSSGWACNMPLALHV